MYAIHYETKQKATHFKTTQQGGDEIFLENDKMNQ